MLQLPDDVFEELRSCQHSSAWLALCLYQHGRPTMIGDERRIYWRGSRAELARLTGLSERGTRRSILELCEHGLLIVHEALTEGRGSAHGYSVVEALEKGRKLTPFRSEKGRKLHPFHAGADEEGAQIDTLSCLHAAGDPDLSPETRDRDQQQHHPRAEKAAKMAALIDDLRAQGVHNAPAWLRQFGPERVAAALAAVPDSGARNPAAMMYHWLESGAEISSPPPDLSTLEGRIEHYLGGSRS